MGTFVFQPDQEGRRSRFSRSITSRRTLWLSRQLPWIATLTVSTLLLSVGWLWLILGSIKGVIRFAEYVTDITEGFQRADYFRYAELPWILSGIALAAVCFAAGQVASILIRSGIIAGIIGLILSAALFVWVLLMRTMQVNFLWSVAPIPLFLLWATWLRRRIGSEKENGSAGVCGSRHHLFYRS